MLYGIQTITLSVGVYVISLSGDFLGMYVCYLTVVLPGEYKAF